MIDVGHPEIAGSNITTTGGAALRDFHGTATSTVAAAPANGVGMLGIWPGARALNVPLPDGQRITLRRLARARSRRAIAAGCRGDQHELRLAVEVHRRGAADPAGGQARRGAGRRRGQRVRERQPARVPRQPRARDHRRRDRARRQADRRSRTRAPRSTSARPASASSRPCRRRSTPTANGRRLRVRRRARRSPSPMVAAAVAWVRAARPELTPFQAGQVVRLGARDVGAAGLRERDRLRRAQHARRARRASRPPTTRSSPTTTSATSTGARSVTRRRRSSPAGPRRSPRRPTSPRIRSTSTA